MGIIQWFSFDVTTRALFNYIWIWNSEDFFVFIPTIFFFKVKCEIDILRTNGFTSKPCQNP